MEAVNRNSDVFIEQEPQSEEARLLTFLSKIPLQYWSEELNMSEVNFEYRTKLDREYFTDITLENERNVRIHLEHTSKDYADIAFGIGSGMEGYIMSVEDLGTTDPYGENVEVNFKINADSPEQDQIDQLMGNIYRHIDSEKQIKKSALEIVLKKDLFEAVDATTGPVRYPHPLA